MKYLFFLIPLIVLIPLAELNAQTDPNDIDLVIAAGLSNPTSCALSSDNKLLATAILSRVMIWDVKTGRQIRDVYFSEDAIKTVDSIYFSPDNATVFVKMPASNDAFHVDVQTGNSEFVESEVPMDYTNYKYVQTNQLKATMHLAGPLKTDMVFPSPDGKKELIYRKVKNPHGTPDLLPQMFEIRLKVKGKETEPLDSAFTAAFIFSADSKYVFADKAMYDLQTGRLISKLRIVESTGMGCAFLPGTHIPVTAGIGNVRIWDFPNVRDIPIEQMIEFKPVEGYGKLVCERYNSETSSKDHVIVDLTTEKVLNTFPGTAAIGNLCDADKDAKRYSFSDINKKPGKEWEVVYTGRVGNGANGNREHNFEGSYKVFFTADPNIVLKDSMGISMFKYNLKTKKEEKFPTKQTEAGTYFSNVSHDHKFILGSTLAFTKEMKYQQRINAWEVETGEVKFEAKVNGTSIQSIALSPDHRLIAWGNSYGQTIHVHEFATGKEVFQLKGHTGFIPNMAFSDDGKRLLSASIDGTRKLWNLETGKEMVSLISTGKDDYAIVAPDQFYYATKGAQSSIHFVKGLAIFPFAQFDLIFNRPDIIIERMLSANTDMIRPYNRAYQKRLSRLGFTEEMLSRDFHLPEVLVTNADALPALTDQGEIKLNLTGTDSKFKLDRILVRVNGVPVHGKGGLDIRGQGLKKVTKEIPVQLSEGKNTFSVSVLNAKGVESLAADLNIEYVPKVGSKPNLHLFTLGVSKHQEGTYDLKYASKDAEDLASLFQQKQTAFGEVFLHQLTDEAVSPESVKELREALQKTTVNDVVCIFFAGHGLLDEDLNYFLAAHQVDFESPAKGGIPYETLEDLLDGIPARKKLMLLDACHSGEIDKEEVAMVSQAEMTHGEIKFRAVGSTGLKQVGLHNSFELMKELFADIRKSSGSVIISSAGGTEFAMEGDNWNNGVFTYCLLNGLKNGESDLNKDGKVMMSEMSRYVREKVYELTDGQQQPTNRAEINETDWRVW